MKDVARVSAVNKAIRSKAFTLCILLIALIVVFTILGSLNEMKFFTSKTFISILQDLAVPAFLAIGAGCLLVSGGIDLSQSGVGAMAGMLVAVGIEWWHLPWFAAMLVALAVAGCIGAINAALVNELRMAPFIATMAMTSVIKALTMLVATDGNGSLKSVLTYENKAFTRLGTYQFGGVLPLPVVLLAIAFVVYGLMLSKSQLGRSIYMIGGNPNAARLSGINSHAISYFLYINCSVLGGVSGLIYTARTKQGSVQALMTDQFTGMTAAILGGISFGGGAGGLGGAFMGLLVIKTFNKGMLMAGSNSFLTTVLSGALLLAALTLDYLSIRRQRKRVGA
ncbi:MAG: ABC transporter permease [Oscillospiraceae bacterium]|jgi:ribose/xylose/arabinose/galactoside ABC-type transport system permease subunit|nr:ABC transporter permease [Oscillospiraceae bacterium]